MIPPGSWRGEEHAGGGGGEFLQANTSMVVVLDRHLKDTYPEHHGTEAESGVGPGHHGFTKNREPQPFPEAALRHFGSCADADQDAMGKGVEESGGRRLVSLESERAQQALNIVIRAR